MDIGRIPHCITSQRAQWIGRRRRMCRDRDNGGSRRCGEWCSTRSATGYSGHRN